MKTDDQITELLYKYDVDILSLDEVKGQHPDDELFIHTHRYLTETKYRPVWRSQVIDLINNAISSEMIKVRERIDELEDDIIKPE